MKRLLGALFLLTITAHAHAWTFGKHYLFYAASDPGTVYYGKYTGWTAEGAQISFSKYAVVNTDCAKSDGKAAELFACAVNAWQNSKQAERKAMINILLPNKVLFPSAQITAVMVD